MSVAKVAISLDDRLLRRLDSLVERAVFRNRSEAIQKAVTEKLPREEQELAEEGIVKDAAEWPEY